MSCEEIKHLLHDLSLGEAAPSGELGRHLAHCAACRAELADLELTRKLLLQGLPEEEPPRRLAFVAERPLQAARFWQWAFAASTALALLLAALVIARAPGKPRLSPPPVATATPAPAGLTRAEVEKMVAAAIEESEQRQRAETSARIQTAGARMADQMRYFERTQNIFYKQAERDRTDLEYIAGLIGRGDQPARRAKQ